MRGEWRKAWARRMKSFWNVRRLTSIPPTVVLWEGESRLQAGAPVRVVATVSGSARSGNEKTGDMVQIAVMRADENPIRAWRAGEEGPVCPDACVHRSVRRGGQGTCYVNKGRLTSAWAASGRAFRLKPEKLSEFGRGALLRLGMEGDPAAAPLFVWAGVTEDCAGWSGYTAHWRGLSRNWQHLFMASCASAEEAKEAEALGWRTFTSSSSLAEDRANEEAGRWPCRYDSHGLSCIQCLGCSGTGRGAKRPSYFVALHGPRGKHMRKRNTAAERQADMFAGAGEEGGE